VRMVSFEGFWFGLAERYWRRFPGFDAAYSGHRLFEAKDQHQINKSVWLLRSQVVSFAGQDLGWIRGVCSAVPGQEAAHGIACHGVEFFAQDFAADG
jgi:hypothetical protein